jgi:acyl-ACP thioesterase
LPVRVRSIETDARGRLQVALLCRLLQEAATLHAAELGVSVESLIADGFAWVLNRMQLKMRSWPCAGEEFEVLTWPEAVNRLMTERRFELRHADGGVFGEATTLWLVLDLDRRRPVRVPPRIIDALSCHDLGDRPSRPQRMTEPARVDRTRTLSVRRSDLDLVGHVNNTSFVEWSMEAIPDRVFDENDLVELDIEYLSECGREATIASECAVVERDAEVEVLHRIIRREDGHALARGRSSWRPSSDGHT